MASYFFAEIETGQLKRNAFGGFAIRCSLVQSQYSCARAQRSRPHGKVPAFPPIRRRASMQRKKVAMLHDRRPRHQVDICAEAITFEATHDNYSNHTAAAITESSQRNCALEIGTLLPEFTACVKRNRMAIRPKAKYGIAKRIFSTAAHTHTAIKGDRCASASPSLRRPLSSARSAPEH